MSIQKLAATYNKFQSDFGCNVNVDYDAIINDLFSAEFKKIANGHELASSRIGLKHQLSGVKDFAGPWTLTEKFIIPSNDHQHCTIRYIISTEKAGRFDVMAILSSKDGQSIDTVDEIFYQLS